MSNKKKILLFTDWYEPGYKAGGPIQSCKNFVGAMEDSYDIHILTSNRDLGEGQPYPGIISDTWITTGRGVRIYYSSPGTLTVKKIRELADALCPDYIYLNSMYSTHFTILPLWLKLTHKLPGTMIIAPRGMLHQGAMQFKSLKKKIFIQLLKRTGVVRKLIFQATDEQEKKDILKHFPFAGKVFVLANFPRMETVEWKQVAKQPGELRCIFISRLAPKKNLLFFLNVLQQIPADLKIHLTLRGEVEDSNYWKKCVCLIEALPSNISVSFEGPLRNDAVTEVLQQYHVFVLPTLGENFGHAIFEALLAGKPVLISDKTPWQRLPVMKVGYDLPLEPPEFVLAIRSYAAMDQVIYNEWSRSAWVYAKTVQQAGSLKEGYKKLLFV